MGEKIQVLAPGPDGKGVPTIGETVVANRSFTDFEEVRTFQTTAFPAFPVSTNWKYESVINSNKWEYVSNTVEVTFTDLLVKWQEATKFQSTSEMFSDEYYQSIIDLGDAVVPYIITALKNEPEHLFIALYKITGENPVKPENRGNIKAMAQDWITWWETAYDGSN